MTATVTKLPVPLRKPTRISSLPILQYCAKAPGLDVGAGRAAAQSTAWHAIAAKSPNAGELLARLTPEERAELETWQLPTPLEVDGQSLQWPEATHEREIACYSDGSACDFYDPHAWLTGHVDGFWTPPELVVVADIKRTAWTTTEGTASLQLAGYGHVLCATYGRPAFLPAIWIATEGRWLVGERVNVASWSASMQWATIQAAANNSADEFSPGSHCSGCWSRLRCPSHMVQLNQDTLVVPGTTQPELDQSAALQLLLDVQRHESATEAARAYLKEWQVRNGGIRDGKGKVWKDVAQAGRESVCSVKELREKLGNDAEQYIKRGAMSRSHRWVNDK